MIVDTHAHLDMLGADAQPALERARAAGVVRVITIVDAAHPHGKALSIVNENDDVFFAAGVHPHDAKHWNEAIEERLVELMTHTKALMVGEIGLDYYRMLSSREEQIHALQAQLELARKLEKPVALHIRDAYDDARGVLREFPDLAGKVILHCFSADLDTARDFLDAGCLVSLAGPVTYPRSDDLREVAARLPLEALLVETDCPFLAPQPVRGRKNEPAFVAYVVEEIGRQRAMEREDVERAIFENTARFFAGTSSLTSFL